MGKKKPDVAGETMNKQRRSHHKHKNTSQPSELSSPQPSIKLKIKIGGQMVGTKSFSVSDDVETCDDVPITESDERLNVGDSDYIAEELSVSASATEYTIDDIIGDEYNDNDITDELNDTQDVEADDDDETEWLNALESGELDDKGELKRDRDLGLLTARQRALLHGQKSEELTELPIFVRQRDTLTDEQLNRRQLRAVKRRERAQEKTEKDKKETLDRLLKKQDSKTKGQTKLSSRDACRSTPVFVYTNNQSHVTVTVPSGFQFPLSRQVAPPVPVVRTCGAAGCTNPRKYSCSRTGVSLCSLECYQKNIATLAR